MTGKNFKIIDKDSGKDITNQYLLQIISDLENKEGSVFPQDVLKDIILSYNNTAQKFMPDLLSKTFRGLPPTTREFLKGFQCRRSARISQKTKVQIFLRNGKKPK